MSTQPSLATIAIAGNPNSGKTTLFNRLTGLRQKVANYAGVTVEKKLGIFSTSVGDIQLIDLPGTYSLSPKSEEERIAAEIVLGSHPDAHDLHGVLCVVDSTALEKSLYLVLQLLDAELPVAVALNMTDELARRHAKIDDGELSRLLGVPVIPISAVKDVDLGPIRVLLENWSKQELPKRFPRLPVIPSLNEIQMRRAKAKEITRQVLRQSLTPDALSDRIDHVVMHPVWGPLIFGVTVLIVFQSIFTWAQPLMNWIDGLFVKLGGLIHSRLGETLLASFLADGVVSGVGSVVVFLPQILIVFFFIAILENSGYLARAALVMDRFMSRIGLQGKSFLPLMSSYACAVPGIMATRTIENKHDRLATILIAPFMTCSARLPVYALLISAFIPNYQYMGGLIGLRSLTLLGLYLLGFLAACFTVWILKSSILKSDKTPFILEIPPYRMPLVQTIFLYMWDRAKVFLQRAGTVILGISIVMWVLVTFPQPKYPPIIHDPDRIADSLTPTIVWNDDVNPIENSFAGRIGHAIEPIIQPLGFNWKIGIGLLSAQAAREVMVSTLSTIYRVESNDDETHRLQDVLQKEITPLTAVSLMIFFVFAMQCTSTLAVTRRETGSWKIPIAMFFYMNAYAYLASLMVYQGGKLLGF